MEVCASRSSPWRAAGLRAANFWVSRNKSRTCRRPPAYPGTRKATAVCFICSSEGQELCSESRWPGQ